MNATATPTLSQQATARDAARGGKRDGDFVHATQDMAAAEGFRNVSRLWYNRTLPMDGVLRALRTEAENLVDFYMRAKSMRVRTGDDGQPCLFIERGDLSEETRILFQPFLANGVSFTSSGLHSISKWADVSGQAVSKLAHHATGDPVAARILSELLNWGLTRNLSERDDDEEVMVRAKQRKVKRKVGEFELESMETKARYIGSKNYSPVNNDWLMDVLSKAIPDGRVSHYRANGDDISGMVLVPDTIRQETDSEYGAAIHFRNSEAGRRRVAVRPSVFRAICMNGCIWGELSGEAFDARHSNLDLDAIAVEIDQAIRCAIPLATEAIATMLSTKEIRFTSSIRALRFIDTFAREHKLTAPERKAWVSGWLEEGADPTAFCVGQGLTRSTRSSEEPNSCQRETLAGYLFSQQKKWWERRDYLAKCEREEVAELIGEYSEIGDMLAAAN